MMSKRAFSSMFVATAGTVALFLSSPGMGAAGSSSVVGNYVCRSMGSRPCDTHTALRLSSNGYWGWGKYSGQYRVRGNTIEFVNGSGGPVSWGPATIGPKGSLVWDDGEIVVWQKPTAAAASGVRAGSYRCASAPGGCQTASPVVLDGQGGWTWGASGGSYDVVGSQIIFHGPTSGPPGWGPADIGSGTLTWRTSDGSSTWSL